MAPARRRARRGSLERPVNSRLYRGSFVVVALAVLLLAFSIVRPAALPPPQLPPNFDGPTARSLAAYLAGHYPDRSPGGAGSLLAAAWFRDQMRQYDLPVSSDTWTATIPGRGRTRLQNLWAVARGQSRQAIVVMAHRDDAGDGTGANDNATGTAALVELARGYALSTTPGSRVRSGHTIVFLSTDAGSFGGLGALRFASRPPFPVVAAIDLDAIGGLGDAADRDRGRRAALAGGEPRPDGRTPDRRSRRAARPAGRASSRS